MFEHVIQGGNFQLGRIRTPTFQKKVCYKFSK